MCSERSLRGAAPTGWIGMPLRPDHCPGDREDIAKSYVMCSLPRTDVAAFQEHLASCIACRRAVEDADKYGKAMREATRRLRSEHGRTG